jgi:hypothetical protein
LTSGTTLKGVLSGNRIDNDELGYYRLSSLSSGFDIFYVMYPNNWLSGFRAGAATVTGGPYSIDPASQDITITTTASLPSTIGLSIGDIVTFSGGGRLELTGLVAPPGEHCWNSAAPSACTVRGILSNAPVVAGETAELEQNFGDSNTLKNRMTVQYIAGLDRQNYDSSSPTIGLDRIFQTGWVRFSDQKQRTNCYYDRYSGFIEDNTGLGAINTPLRFNDWTVGLPKGAMGRVLPQRSWIYNLGAHYNRGIIDIRAKNAGNLVGSASFRIENPEKSYLEFNASEDVFIGASCREQGGAIEDFRGFRGGIAAIVIYNRKLTGAEVRVVMGNLYDKYIHIKSQSTATLVAIEKNRQSDLNGIAGHIWFEPTP